jgi:hypothetical protein
MLLGRVRVVPGTYPLKEDTVVDCIPSFVGQTTALEVPQLRAVPYLAHGRRKYLVEV